MADPSQPQASAILVIGHGADLAPTLATLDPRLRDPSGLRDFRTEPTTSLRQHAGLILTDGVSASEATAASLDVIRGYVDSGKPVLASGRGAHLLNAACDNGNASEPASRLDFDTAAAPAPRTSLFLTVGSKTASTIGGSGWLTLRNATLQTIPLAALADDMMPAAFTEDSAAAAFEAPGHAWVIGVAWDIAAAADLPTGFGNLLEAFVDRTIG